MNGQLAIGQKAGPLQPPVGAEPSARRLASCSHLWEPSPLGDTDSMTGPLSSGGPGA